MRATQSLLRPCALAAVLMLGTCGTAVAQSVALPSDSVRRLAEHADGVRLVVSVRERRLWAMRDRDTLRVASVAVGSERTLRYQGKRWRFSTPRGVRTVLSKDSLPLWIPPEWHYYEAARTNGWSVRSLVVGRPVTLADGRRLVVRDDRIGTLSANDAFTPVPADEEVVFDGVLYIPPPSTRNRRIAGELGRYRLVLGDGIALHGTPYTASIGQATTHGCIRLADADIAWLYDNVPIGTPVYVY